MKKRNMSEYYNKFIKPDRDKEINQTILETLRGVAHEFGKMNSPTA